jgi:hypothetical protein
MVEQNRLQPELGALELKEQEDNMPGGFLQGLARGSYNYQTQSRAKKEAEINEQKQQTLKLLTGLYDKTEPSSQPALLRHIGDVIGLKGQHKSVWDRITGADLQSDKGALQGKLSEILGTLRGPEEYKQASPKSIPSGGAMGPMGMPLFTGIQKTQDRRDPSSIYLRDPQNDEIEKIQARYQAQSQAREDQIKQKSELDYIRQSKLQEENAKLRGELGTQMEDLRTERELRTRAKSYARRRPGSGGVVSEQDMRDAADDMEIERGYKLDNLRARTGLALDRSVESKANVEALKSGKGISAAEARGEGLDLRKQEMARQRGKDASAIYGRYQEAYKMANKLGQEIQGIYQKIEGQGFFLKNGELYRKADGQKLTPAQQSLYGGRNPMVGLNIQALQKLEATKEAAMGQMRQIREQMGRDYQDLYDVGGDEWGVYPKTQNMVPSVGGKGTQELIGRPPQNRIGKMGEETDYSSDRENLMPTDIITVGRNQGRIIRRLGTKDGKTQYKVKWIR